MKRWIAVVAAVLLGCEVCWAQEALSEWVKAYIEARLSGTDSAMPLVRINDYYKAGDAAQRAACREQIKAEAAKQLREGNQQAVLDLVSLHDFIVTDDADRSHELYLVEGNIHAQRNDSVRLKQTIDRLTSLGAKPSYLAQLNGYLEKMRNYVPADKYLEGYWVSDERMAQRWRDVEYATSPYYLFKAEQVADTARLTLLRGLTAGLYGEAAEQMKHPQLVIPYAADSLYILWASERLRNINPERVASYRNIVRETSAQVSGIFAQRHQYSSSEQLGNQLMTNVAEMGINALISSLSTPKKTIVLVEFRLKRINDRLFSGTRHSYLCVVSADGKKQETDYIYPCNLHRWDKESGILFGNNQLGKNYFFYGHDKEEQVAAKEDEDGYYMQSYRNYKNNGTVTRSYYEYIEAFNTAQFRQLEIYNQRLLDPAQTPIIEVPEGMKMAGWLGATVAPITPEWAAEQKLSIDGGLRIEAVGNASPALVAGLKVDDVLQRIDGVAVDSAEALERLIRGYAPRTEVVIEALREGKPFTRKARLSYQFVPNN